ncbi:MAG: lipopolysaccharide heptosyltransferase I [Burkholderiales bacterium]
MSERQSERSNQGVKAVAAQPLKHVSPRILIVKLSSLGDVIHAMPVVQDLLAARPGARIDWVVEPGFTPLVRRVAGVQHVVECAQRRWRRRGIAGWFAADVKAEKQDFLRALQTRAYDWVLDLQGLTKSALVARRARLTPLGQRIALANRTEGSGYEAPTRWVAHRAIHIEPHTHVLDRSRQMAAHALGYPLQGPPRFGLNVQAARDAASTVALVHGSSRNDKLWPEPHWVTLGQRLAAQGWRIALPQGSAAEAERGQRLAQAIGPAHCEVWPTLALDALVDRLAACRGVIGVDSGLSHLAVALDLAHVQLYNFPTAWRTGPQPAHGHRHQVSVGGDHVPSVDEAWAAWQKVMPTLWVPDPSAAPEPAR